ncbi:hypothetical protein [Chrysochromulina parva virus BQ2]|uniref:Uncharacterized protein n=1 Tax=Chrysochromulina parva virus BQ2 TaxID=3070831 RepID=A0A4Y6GRA4_9VIRU|nr:hypothetical protein QKE47_gp30 [Chrysochromulina parva virus]QDF45921.1 hypothetical protein [Chrysochromulina parva virus BQ2]
MLIFIKNILYNILILYNMSKTHKKKHYSKKKHYAKKNKPKAGKNAQAESRELLASIQAYQLQLEEITQSITRIYPILIIKVRQYKTFINSVFTSYEYRRKNIPSILLTMITQIRTVLERVNHIIRFYNEPGFLQSELAANGYNDIVAFIALTQRNIIDLDANMQYYTQNALDDYKGAQLGIETQPNMRNSTTRRTDAIVRPPRTTRAQALTRRIRSY